MGDQAKAPAASPVRTTSASLQAKLDALVALAASDDLTGFVAIFVPLDIPAEDIAEYQKRLAECAEEWAFLKADIQAIASGEGVIEVEGNETERAVFRFKNPGQQEDQDREVAFVCTDGDWRAEG